MMARGVARLARMAEDDAASAALATKAAETRAAEQAKASHSSWMSRKKGLQLRLPPPHALDALLPPAGAEPPQPRMDFSTGGAGRAPLRRPPLQANSVDMLLRARVPVPVRGERGDGRPRLPACLLPLLLLLWWPHASSPSPSSPAAARARVRRLQPGPGGT